MLQGSPPDRSGASSAEPARQTLARGLRKRWPIWALVLLLALTIPWLQRITRPAPEPPPDLGPIGGFQLMDQDGQPFGMKDLRGRVWVGNFIFTNCATVCPRLTAAMAQVQARLGPELGRVRIVSISVDPERDTPEVLRGFGQRYGADFNSWSFLTGPLEQIEDVVVGSFRTAIERRELADTGLYDIVHSERMVLVDPHGHLRGYYGSDEEGLALLLKDIRFLLEDTRGLSPDELSVLSLLTGASVQNGRRSPSACPG